MDTNTFGALRARSIGPAVMGGRITALDATSKEPHTIYVGSASGGLWKSIDGGIVFRPIFDEHTQSIGAVTCDPSDDETIWVGTGESWTRNSTSVGDGVYKSTDAGKSWQHVGLEDSERIARIVVHPTKRETVYVCATGHLWNANPMRGVFRTTDGGKSWKKILYIDEDTGCSWLSIDPQDPQILYAGMWQFRRSPDFFSSGGPGSGLYRSVDGGESWTELREGLPEGDLGRIAVEPAPSRPSTVYAVVESEGGAAFYRSRDFGEHWEKRSTSMNVKMRPFYFALLVPDPEDYEMVYKPGLSLGVTRDGGRTFSSPFGSSGFGSSVHSDLHALWINPSNPKELFLGTDGGLYHSLDRGATWRHLNNLPIAQFYQVGYDMSRPYHVMGGLQDNGSWRGPSTRNGGILNRDWIFLNGGDGFHAYPDLSDPQLIYAEYQGGHLSRIDLSTGEAKDIQPWARGDEQTLRFNWNMPVVVSQHTKNTLYVGSQYLHRSRDRGDTWETISPDLTTNDPQRQRQKSSGGLTIDNSTAENNTTIFSIAESPLDPDLLWVGSDDGRIHLTRDGGASWSDVTANVPGLAEGAWVSQVEASAHDAATALIAIDDHRRGDMRPQIFVTNDFGQSWRSIVGEGLEGFAHVIRQDPLNPQLLFAGTEFGLYISLDGGEHWARFSGNLPRVPVHDLKIHPREQDLIIATHGRGIYILDDLTPLRSLGEEVLNSDIALLPSRPAVMTVPGLGNWFPSDAEFVGESVPEAVSIFFYQKRRHLFGDLKVEILGQDGTILATLPAGKRRGLNRVVWAMRKKPPELPPASSLVFSFTGPRVAEGRYTFRLTKGSKQLEGQVELVADPRSPHSTEDRELQQRSAMRLYDALSDLTYLVESIANLRDQASERAKGLRHGSSLAARLEDFGRELEELRASMVSTSDAGWLSGDEKLREHMGNLFGSINNYQGKPTATQLEQMEVLLEELKEKQDRFERLLAQQQGRLNKSLERQGLEPIGRLTRSEWLERRKAAGSSGLVNATAGSLHRTLERALPALLP